MNKKLMAHIVYGYPDTPTSLYMLEKMDNMGVEYIEVQIPFSDPMADGPILSHANSEAAKHTSTDDVLNALQKVTGQLQTSRVVVMCYFQSIFSYGIEQFCAKVAAADIAGLIVPDLPSDQPEYRMLLAKCGQYGLTIIPVLSSNMDHERLEHYIDRGTELVYVTARLGVTGSHTDGLQISKVVEFTDAIKLLSPKCEVALGFGIQTAEDIKKLPDSVAIVVVGSAITSHLDTDGKAKATKFIDELVDACHGRVDGKLSAIKHNDTKLRK